MNQVDFEDFDSDNDATYGLSTNDKELLLLNDCEIFHKRSTKRTIDHGLSLTWACQNRSNCNATLNSSRDYGDLDGSDYDIVRKRVHSIERFTNRVTNHWGFMLFILKESYLQSAYLERMRGGEQVPGRRRKYRRNEEMIMRHRANLVADNIRISSTCKVVYS